MATPSQSGKQIRTSAQMTGQEKPLSILVISFSYRPLNNPRSFRWSHLTEQFAKLGHRVDVVTSWVPGRDEIEQDGLLTIYRVGWEKIERLRARQRDSRSQAGTGTALAKSPFGALRGMLLGAVIRTWRAIHWPDAACLWYFPARTKALSLVKAHQYDVVVSVAPPFTAVLVGRHVRNRCEGPAWILDLGDPFSFLEGAPPNNRALYGRLNETYERAAFREADGVSVTNPQTMERYEAVFPESKGKIRVIPPLLSMPPIYASAASILGRLVYVGTLYRHIREPTFLLELFTRACRDDQDGKLELHFFGDVSACIDILGRYQERLGKRLCIHGLVGRDKVAEAMGEADILINIGNDTTYQLPSKVVEYAASGKPIVNIAKTEQDSSVRFFSSFPYALNLVTHDGMPSDSHVSQFSDFIRHPPERASRSLLDAWLAPYRTDSVIGDYLDLLRRRRG